MHIRSMVAGSMITQSIDYNYRKWGCRSYINHTRESHVIIYDTFAYHKGFVINSQPKSLFAAELCTVRCRLCIKRVNGYLFSSFMRASISSLGTLGGMWSGTWGPLDKWSIAVAFLGSLEDSPGPGCWEFSPWLFETRSLGFDGITGILEARDWEMNTLSEEVWCLFS